MKKHIYKLVLLIACGVILLSCKDQTDDVAGNISVKGTVYAASKRHLEVKDNETRQLEAVIMPNDLGSEVVYSITGIPTGAISISETGLITPKIQAPPTGEIPIPLGVDTIMVSLKNNPNVFVVYPVKVMSSIVLVTSITLKTAGQTPQIEKGKTFNLAEQMTINPATATDKTVTYSSLDPTVATIDANGVITALGEGNQTTTITITSNDRTKTTATSIVTIVAEAPKYIDLVNSAWVLSSNLETKEGTFAALLDDLNSTFWAPDILTRPNYSPECWLDIDMGSSQKIGQFALRHRNLNYAHVQLYKYKLEAKKTEADSWTSLGEFTTTPLVVATYNLAEFTPLEARYLRMTLIQGHLRAGKTDWDYSEAGNVSIGDLKIYRYNR